MEERGYASPTGTFAPTSFLVHRFASPQVHLVAGRDPDGSGATEVDTVDTRSAGHSAANRSTKANRNDGDSSVPSPFLRALLKRQDPGKRPSTLPISATQCTPGLFLMRGWHRCPKLKTSSKHHTLQPRPSYHCWVLKRRFFARPRFSSLWTELESVPAVLQFLGVLIFRCQFFTENSLLFENVSNKFPILMHLVFIDA